MTWAKIDDHTFGDARFASVSRDAQLLHLEGLVWTMAHEATGSVARGLLRRVSGADDPATLAAELVTAGIWEERDDGWTILYGMSDQATADEIESQREWNRAKQARHRRHTKGDHSLCRRPWCAQVESNPVTDPVIDPSRNGIPTRPDPTVGKGRGKGNKAPRPPAADAASGRSATSVRPGPWKGPDPAPADASCWVCGAIAPEGVALVTDPTVGFYAHPNVEEDEHLTAAGRRAWTPYANDDGTTCEPGVNEDWVSCQRCSLWRSPDQTTCPECGETAVYR